MLRSELLDQPYNKAEHRRALSPQLDDRSKGSIEFKHQNVSAVMVDLGLPYIEGYKPRGNFQALLADGVKDYLDAHPGFLEGLADAPIVNPDQVPLAEPSSFDAVKKTHRNAFLHHQNFQSPGSRGIPGGYFAARDAANRRLGQIGEQWVVEVERQRLLSAGRKDLAIKVEWVAKSIGDGLGFDVLSFNEIDNSERLIEVKTTGLGKCLPHRYFTRPGLDDGYRLHPAAG